MDGFYFGPLTGDDEMGEHPDVEGGAAPAGGYAGDLVSGDEEFCQPRVCRVRCPARARGWWSQAPEPPLSPPVLVVCAAVCAGARVRRATVTLARSS